MKLLTNICLWLQFPDCVVICSERKKLIRGPSVQLISSVPINAKVTLQMIEDLKPLVQALPADKNERKR